MPRPLRVQYEGAWHHVVNRGAGRQDVFRDREDRLAFLELIGEVAPRYEVETHAYCLMGNHYHLLLRTPAKKLDLVMQIVGSRYTKRFNNRHGRDGPLFRGRYYSSLIETDRYLLATSRYIHRNPLELGLKRLANYEWSSYGAHVRKHLRPDWLAVDHILKLVGGTDAYRAIVECPLRTDLDAAFEAGV